MAPQRSLGKSILLIMVSMSGIWAGMQRAPVDHSIHRRQEVVGSACSSEGQWYCMTNSWQRCASGQWGVVMPCAAGTSCSPAGLTTDLQVQQGGQGQAQRDGAAQAQRDGEAQAQRDGKAHGQVGRGGSDGPNTGLGPLLPIPLLAMAMLL
ncbi:hypothetical protein RJ55_02522 [Drechmeria coniospora]|nr:hypothetical protein RJ55_02522 [Drechmeria coniospora]